MNCEICGKPLKRFTQSHINSKFHQDALNKKDNEIEDYLSEKSKEFDNHEVIETEEETVKLHHNNERAFWNAFSKDVNPSKGSKNVGSIDQEMSSGTKTAWDLWRYEITNLSYNEWMAWSTLRHCPLFGELVEDLIQTKRHRKAWLAKKLFRYFAEHMKAFTNVYHNKKIQKALNKISGQSFDSGDF